MDSTDRREWLYTQSDDAVVAHIMGLEVQIAALTTENTQLRGRLGEAEEFLRDNSRFINLLLRVQRILQAGPPRAKKPPVETVCPHCGKAI